MRKIVVSAALLLATAAAGPLFAQEQAAVPAAGPLTLGQAVEQALGRNPMIGSANARREIAAARLLEAKSGWLPRVDVTETIMRSDNPVFVFGSLLEQGRFGPENFDPGFLNDPEALTNFRLALNVRFPLFDQFRRYNAIRQARNGVAMAGEGTEEARQAIRLETISRFYGVMLARERKRVADDAVRSAEADAAAMHDRFEQGLLVESDLLSAEVQLASFRQQAIEATGNVAIAEAALATVIRSQTTATPELAGTIPERTLPEPPIDEAVASGLASRGEVKIAGNAAANARLQTQTAKGSLLPRVDTFASWGASSGKLTGGDPDKALGVVIGLDLFDGGKYARIAESRAALAVATSEEQAVRDRVTMEIIGAWHRARAARERTAVATRSVEQASAATAIVRDRYENGLTTITEQLRAQTALLASRLDLLAARYDYVTSYAELLRATGGLNDVSIFN